MDRNQLSTVRRIALLAVAGNLALFALLAAVLPQVLLPIPALMLPLLTAAAIESAQKRSPRARARKAPRPRSLPRMQRALSHAA
jgi:hypothetical protein